MTHWCPVCESPGVAVSQGIEATGRPDAVAVSRDLPGIAPTHLCSRCPTFFRSRDRFFLTAQHGSGVHGIAVWPHRDRPISIEIGEEGMVATFPDGASVLISRDDSHLVATDFFLGAGESEIRRWASRRGFGLRLSPSRGGMTDLVVDRPGPHFILVVTKSWFQSNEIRSTEAGIRCLETIGVLPVLFPPTTAGYA